MQTFRIAIIVATLAVITPGYSQTSVFLGANKIAGVCWGGTELKETDICAENKCKADGGINPKKIFSYRGKGFGALVKSKNGVMGCSAGALSPQSAINLAIVWSKKDGGDSEFITELEWEDK